MENKDIAPISKGAIMPADIADLLAPWLDALALRVKAGEMAATSAGLYERGMNKFVAWWSAEHPGAVVDADLLRQWKADLLTNGKKPATVNAWLAGVKSFYAWANETGRMNHNPTLQVKGATRKGANKKHARESLTDLEVMRVLDKAKANLRDYAILSLMVYTGIRSAEVNRADLGDLKTEGGQLVLYVRGKGHQEADELVVVASTAAQNALYDWIAERGSWPGPLFTSQSNRSNGERLSLKALRTMVKHYFKLAGVQGNKTAHSLRHTAITKVILKSGSIQKAQSVARHKSIDTTMIYFHEIDRISNPGESFIEYGDKQQ